MIYSTNLNHWMAGIGALVVAAIGLSDRVNAKDQVAATQQGLPVTIYLNQNATDTKTKIAVDGMVDVLDDYCPVETTDKPFLLPSGKPLNFKSKFLFHVEGHRPTLFSDIGSGGTNTLRKCAPDIDIPRLTKPKQRP